MTTFLPLFLILLALIAPIHQASAAESKELRKQRQEAHKARQQKKNARSIAIRDATKSFIEYTRDLKKDYQERVKDLDVAFKLTRVELEADRDAKIATAEAEYQQKMSGLFMRQGMQFDEDTIKNLEHEGKAYADELFRLRKAFAEELQKELLAKEHRVDDLLSAQDRMAIDKASELGLTQPYPPILATPVGDGLTRHEEQWNAREKKEIARIEAQNRRTLSTFVNGAKLRAWEMTNLEQDFKLTWSEKEEIHALDSQQTFYNILFMQAASGGEIDQQAFMSRLSELAKDKRLIKINYKKTRDQNRIKRREEKRSILGR